MSPFDRLESVGLKQQIEARLKQAILDGAFAPGQQLVEGEIARQFGVSRSPVREAIQDLQRQGYVVKKPRRGTFVTELTPQDRDAFVKVTRPVYDKWKPQVGTDVVASTVARVKASHIIYDTPVTVGPSTTVGEAMSLLPKRAHGAVVVIEDGQVLGIVTERDGIDIDRFAQVSEIMTGDVLTFDAGADPRRCFYDMSTHHVAVAPVLEGGRLVGVLTRKGALRSTIYEPATDSRGRLVVGAAVGINGDVAAKATTLLELGIDVLVVDTAHGHQAKMLDALPIVVAARDAHESTSGQRVAIAAGNVVSAEGVHDLVAAGADIVKVGVGPGAMCTTRMMTGVGRPQFSAVLECADAARRWQCLV